MPNFIIVRVHTSEITRDIHTDRQTDKQINRQTDNAIYIYRFVEFILLVCWLFFTQYYRTVATQTLYHNINKGTQLRWYYQNYSLWQGYLFLSFSRARLYITILPLLDMLTVRGSGLGLDTYDAQSNSMTDDELDALVYYMDEQ